MGGASKPETRPHNPHDPLQPVGYRELEDRLDLGREEGGREGGGREGGREGGRGREEDERDLIRPDRKKQ